MTERTQDPVYMSEDGLWRAIEPENPELRTRYEALIREDFERSHPHDTLEALRHRARFSKEDQGLLRDWMDVAARRARERKA